MRRVPTYFVLIWPLLAAALCAEAARVRVVLDSTDRPAAVEAIRLTKDTLSKLTKLDASDPALSRHFMVFVLDAQGRRQKPALAGRYEIVGDIIRFTPQFGFRPGLKYEA